MGSYAALTEEEYATLTRLSAARTWVSLFGDYTAILALTVAVVLVPHSAIVALGVLVIARQQHALAGLMHEGVHYRLFPSRRLNDLVARWLLAGPLLISYEGYRRTHLDHHLHTMTEDDPDFRFVSDFPVSKRRFLSSFAPDFIGLTSIFLIFHYARLGSAGNLTARRFVLGLLPGIVFNGVLLVAAITSGYVAMYLVCWLVPLFFVLPFFLHLRGVSEHGGHTADPDPMKCTWTVINPAQTFLIAPHHINYHVEHHGYPAILHFNLPKLHDLLEDRGALPMENVHTSYRAILTGLVISE